ncbi:phage tail protein [Ectopseudomonas toyotomiensis]|uniref:Phage tail tube protein n=1 Tax=Ectopseudomonas toyotomiensis TaxID=554344 RepID=A0A1I5PDW3_9GAMM|nr:phage tail tube protein [Pseudomonas toyotomiensis]PIA73643.1 phage tail protein [Pseudomonas toyotomiensis]SFP32284.1 Phage tail tube protein [Pseudomonas toyotomiensis]
MSGKVTGVATIRVDGREMPTERGATLNPGGVNRPSRMAGKRVFFNEEPVAPTLQCTVLHTEEIDLIDLNTITNATVLFECDNGQDYMLTGAFVTETTELNSAEGQVRLNMAARRCERI